MEIKQSLIWAAKQLKTSNSPALDAEVLLSFVLKKDKTFLFAHGRDAINRVSTEKFKKLISRRAKHEPVAYITNSKEFYGLDFYVDENVLIPRPATELMVEKALKIISDSKHPITLIDVGTGSGCIPISIIKNLETNSATGLPSSNPVARVMAIDSSKEALKIAKKNASKFGVHPAPFNRQAQGAEVFQSVERCGVQQKIKFLHGNLLEPLLANSHELENSYTIITANLPYLTTAQYKNLPPEIKKYEPKSALVAGKDGMKYYKKLFKQIKTLNLKSQLLYECQSGRLQSKSFLN